MPGGAEECFFQADNYQRLRAVYQGKLPESAISENIRRLAEPGALTSALNWYRALNLEVRIGKISPPSTVFRAGSFAFYDLGFFSSLPALTCHVLTGCITWAGMPSVA